MTHKTKKQIDMVSKCVAIYLSNMLVENVLSYQHSLGFLKSVIMSDRCKVKESFQEDYQLDYIY